MIKQQENFDEIDRHVAKRLRKFRSEARMSQKKLAECIGVSFQQVQKYESVKNKISISRLFEFSKILGVSMASFFDGLNYRSVRCGFAGKSFEIDDDLYSIEEIKEYLPLIKAYGKIENERIRRNVLELVKSISGPEFVIEKKGKK